MEKKKVHFNKWDLNQLIRLKRYEIKVKENHLVNESDIKDYLFDTKWKKKKSLVMCDLIDDVMSIEFSDLFDYLSVKAVKDAYSLDINAFEDLISK